MAIKGAGKAAIEKMVRERVEVRCGNLTGRKLYGGEGTGRLWIGHHMSFRDADYAIYSYATPIAWYRAGSWVVPGERYSVTTTNHQNNVRMALHFAGQLAHVDYPHLPGTLYDCPACEASGELDPK